MTGEFQPWPTAVFVYISLHLHPGNSCLNIDQSANVLDIGAGTRALLRLLQARGHSGHLEGIDPQPGKGIRAGTAEALPSPDHAFDVVLLVRVLAHLHSPLAAIHEARRVLRTRGQLVTASHGADHLAATWQALGRTLKPHGPDQALSDALALAGLEARRTEIHIPIQMAASDAHALLASYGESFQPPKTAFPLQDTLHTRLR